VHAEVLKARDHMASELGPHVAATEAAPRRPELDGNRPAHGTVPHPAAFVVAEAE
jgi:hypothetical protein